VVVRDILWVLRRDDPAERLKDVPLGKAGVIPSDRVLYDSGTE
jgi:hypothetical protein